MDTNALEAGKEFTDLPETYVIFITEIELLRESGVDEAALQAAAERAAQSA